MSSEGSQIQSSSFHKMTTPPAVKNASTLRGDTSMGRNGEKYLALSNGARKAILIIK